ncbi:endonuclease III-like protein 1 [Achlya hypogyna]|uniref:Endonuclease III homolog n=1 Tax=Achlya hypogyna TaxID=1202772 RepID=A0A1V9YAA5_ACHHY|nr:endonuclease III-like protein 1 [Achlya hypogyna]
MQLRSRAVAESQHIVRAVRSPRFASSKRLKEAIVKSEPEVAAKPEVVVKPEPAGTVEVGPPAQTPSRGKRKAKADPAVDTAIPLYKLEIQDAKDKSDSVVKKPKTAPAHWEDVWNGIAAMRAARTAAVDTQGCESFNDPSLDPPVRRFHVLVASMLSSQTKDPVTAAAMERLKAHGLSVANILATDHATLAQLLRPVGFFNNKATYLHKTCAILQDKYASDIPPTFDELVALPGVGPKMAHLTMSAAWEKTVGICVDVHVHRISNRLGWVKTWNKANPKSQDPEKTRKELEDWLPYDLWNPVNAMLVGFGQEICLPMNPRCADCGVRDLCPSASKKLK